MAASVSKGARHRLKGSANAVRIRAPQIGGEIFFFCPTFHSVLSLLYYAVSSVLLEHWCGFKKGHRQYIFDLNSSIISPVPSVIMLLLINKSWQGLGCPLFLIMF